MKMNMKKIISWGMMLAAAFTLTNCAKEIDAPVQEPESVGYPFEIVASTVDTKTVNDGVHTNWSAGDQINIIHAAAGTETYVSEAAFTIAAEDLAEGRFTGTLKGALTDGTHDWYVLYPYSSYTASPAKSGYLPIGCQPKNGENQVQDGNNSMAHIAGANYPLWGNAKGVAHDAKPSVPMSHVASLVKVVVTNATESPLTVENIAFTAPVDIVGTYYINFSGETVECTNSGTQYVSKTATLNVNNGEAIEAGGSAEFYLAVRPFTAEAGTSLSLAVNGYSKVPKALANAVTFHAGKIKTLNFAYDEAPATGEKYTIKWDSNSEWTDSYTKLVSGDYTVQTVKNDGSTAPTVNSSDNDCRVYAKGSVTVSHSSANMKKLVFNISAQGKKRLAPITATVGSVIVDSNNYKVIWEGDSNTVTFTVGEKADYGTDGSSKAGQLCFDSIDATSGKTGDNGDETPTIQPRNLEFSVTNVSAVIGQSFTKPVLSGETSGVTYSSSNANVATVDELTGDVTLVGIGTTIIKASAPATAEYEAGEVSYTLTVSSSDILVEDGTYIIAVKENGAYYAASIDSNGNRRAFVTLEGYSSGSYLSNNSKIVWTITNVAGGIIVNMGDKYWGAAKNEVPLGTSDNAVAISISRSDEAYYLSANCGNDGTRYLSKNDDYGFGFYAESNKENVYLIPATFVELPDLEKPVVTAELNDSEDGINVSWNAVPNAQKYVVTCGNNSKEVTTTEYEFTELSSGSYSITVKAMAENYNSATSEAVEVVVPSTGSGEVEPAWTLVTDASTLKAGDQIVIVAKNASVAMSTTQNNNNRGQVSITKSGNNVTIGSTVQVLTLKEGKSSGSYSFYTGSGYLYAASTSSNHLKTQTTLDTKGSWKISITSDGIATVKSVGNTSRGWMRHNSSSSLFACYASGQNDICIYKYQ